MKKDIFIPLALIIFLGLLLEPFGFMPTMAVMTVLILVVAAFVLFSLFLWREKGADEREEAHIHKADRVGFIAGALVLLVAVVAESLGRMLSPWLVAALAAMIAAKAVALVYQKNNH
jgi:Na+/H+ antiporter NhaD/arsenite permease-like protein